MKSTVIHLLILLGICTSVNALKESSEIIHEEDDGLLHLYYVKDAQTREAVCNDGTDSGFYFRQGSTGITRWVIHLQGGWWCWDSNTCADRWNTSTILMTNKLWSQQISISGIFSTNSTDNPDFYNANAVYIPYCSSDSWSGDIGKDEQGEWDFRGKKIVKAVIEDLMNYFYLDSANEVIFSGTSAGGQGVIVNVDFVNQILAELMSVQNYAGIADAGWMQNIQPLYPTTVSIEMQFRLGIEYWNGQVDNDCAVANPGNEWMCYVSPYAYPYIQSQVLIQTEQYDSFQVPYDCCSPPFSNEIQQAKVDSIRAAFLSSLPIVKSPSTVFSAACYTHSLVENSQFWTIGIDGVNMREVLGNWFFGRDGTTRAVDDCKGFNCSQNCPSS